MRSTRIMGDALYYGRKVVGGTTGRASFGSTQARSPADIASENARNIESLIVTQNGQIDEQRTAELRMRRASEIWNGHSIHLKDMIRYIVEADGKVYAHVNGVYVYVDGTKI